MCPLLRHAVLLILISSTLPGFAADDANAGKILCAYWRQIPGKEVADLKKVPAFPNAPNEQVFLDKLETPADQEPNFGTLIRGFILPPADGAYTFSISSDEQSELWLSTSEDSAAKAKIASVPTWNLPDVYDQFPEQHSKPVTLKAGQKYYIEVLHKDGGGDNHLQVAWKMPDGTTEAPIPGKRLAPMDQIKVAPPVVVFEPPVIPTEPGQHRLKAQIDYMNQKLTVPVLLTIPQVLAAEGKNPVIVYLPDIEQPADNDGFRMQGPDREWEKKQSFRKWARFIGISLQCPMGRDWTQRIYIQAALATLTELLNKVPADKDRVYLTGWVAGGTAVWRLAVEKPELFAALAPVCGTKVDDKASAPKLMGMPVYMITGVKNGFATGCANDMMDLLASNLPKPLIYYEMEMGSEVADKAYGSPWLYAWILKQRKGVIAPPDGETQAPAPPPMPGGYHFVAITLSLSFAFFVAAMWLILMTPPKVLMEDDPEPIDEGALEESA